MKSARPTRYRLRIESLENRTLLAAGALDLTFGSDPKLVTPVGPGNDYGQSMALQPDGKLVVAGYSFNGFDDDFTVVRYNADGTLDTSFSGDGKVTTDVGPFEQANSVVVQTDGKIIVAGFYHNGVTFDFAVVRYNADGSLDTSFDGDGIVTTDFFGASDKAYAVTLQPDGKIVVAGASFTSGSNRFALARYNANGSLDASFHSDGMVTVSFGGLDDSVAGVAIQADGKIVAVGYSNVGGNYDFAVARFNANGSPDTAFSGDGLATTDFGGGDDFGDDVALLPDGGIVVVGYVRPGADFDFGVARFTANGSLDTSFDGDGKVSTDFGSGDDLAFSVAVQFDNKIVVAGAAFNNRDFGLARYNADGSLDTSFDGDGMVTTPFGVQDELAYGVAIQSDGKIVAAGYTLTVGFGDFAVARYNPDGSLGTFGDGTGKVTTAIGNADDQAFGVAVQPDGKIIAGGYAWNGSNYDFALTRYNRDGSLDPSFDGDGRVTTGFGSSDDYIYGIALQPNGQIVAVGNSWNGTDFDCAIARYNSDGSLDLSFNGSGKVTTTIGGADDAWTCVVVQPDGRPVAAGYFWNGSNYDFCVGRYNVDGSLDGSFNGTGTVTTVFGGADDNAHAIALQPDGKIIVAGTFWAGNFSMAICRYNPDGSLDSSFDGDGRVGTDFVGNTDGFRGVAVQPDGMIVAAGYVNYGGNSFDYAVVRYNPDGSLDSTFDGDGKTSADMGGRDLGASMVMQPDGKILVAGWDLLSSGNCWLARFNTNGSIDTTFGGGGRVSTAFGGPSETVGNGVAVGPDGSIVVVGRFYPGATSDFAIARFRNDNHAPAAVADTVILSEDSAIPVALSVLANDADPDNDPLRVNVLSQPAHGKLYVLGGGFQYVPDANYSGTDSFTYKLSDDSGLFDVGQVQLVITPVNDNPSAADDAASLPEDSPATAILVLGNDSSSPDGGETLTITGVTQGLNGGVVITGGGTGLTYQPNGNFNGSDSFTYTISDGNGGTNTATVNVTVTSVNDAPPAVDNLLVIPEDFGPVLIDVLFNDGPNVDSGETLTIVGVTPPAHGTAVIVANQIEYTPAANFNGSDSFFYSVSDGNGGLAVAMVSINITSGDDLPAAAIDAAAVNEDSAIEIAVLGNDTGLGDGPLTVTITTLPLHGTAIVTAGNTVLYIPAGNYFGGDSFFYQIQDADADFSSAQVNITVNALNDNPTANPETAVIDSDNAFHAIAVLSNDTSAPDNPETLTVTGVTQGLNGQVTFTGSDVSYKPNVGFVGGDSFTYTIGDGNGGTATATVTVIVMGSATGNTPPDADVDNVTIPSGGASLIDVLANDSDADFDVPLILAVTQGANGTVAIAGGFSSVIYTPAANFVGNDSFSYMITDGNGGTDAATVNVTVVAALGFKLAAASGSEAVKTVKIIVTRSPVQAVTATVDYSVVGGDATSPADFTLLGTGTVTFKPNKPTATIKMKIANDTQADGNEDVVLGLSNASNGLLIGPNVQHTYTIIDNDGAAAAREAYLLDALFTNWRAPKRRLDVRI